MCCPISKLSFRHRTVRYGTDLLRGWSRRHGGRKPCLMLESPVPSVPSKETTPPPTSNAKGVRSDTNFYIPGICSEHVSAVVSFPFPREKPPHSKQFLPFSPPSPFLGINPHLSIRCSLAHPFAGSFRLSPSCCLTAHCLVPPFPFFPIADGHVQDIPPRHNRRRCCSASTLCPSASLRQLKTAVWHVRPAS
ncbi:hypothetical protein LY78DRAFT_357664 [Colletotrichum sublineola]|nr:hypothetical protein LY78DRAFT_357664 [Colletotrichum sublineola]